VYLKFSSLSEIPDSGVPVLSIEHTPVLHETMPNTKPEEVKTKQMKIKFLLESKIKTQSNVNYIRNQIYLLLTSFTHAKS
jgi:hypothetical protein